MEVNGIAAMQGSPVTAKVSPTTRGELARPPSTGQWITAGVKWWQSQFCETASMCVSYRRTYQHGICSH